MQGATAIRQLAVSVFLCLIIAGVLPGQTFNSSGLITINQGTVVAATPYPTASNCTPASNAACINVTGLTGTFTSLSVTLTYSNDNSQSLSSPAILLQSPDGTHNLDIMSFGCGDPPGTGSNGGFTVTLTDSASSLFPSHTVNCTTLAASYRPAAYGLAAGGDSFPSPGPGTSFTYAGDGTNGSSGTGTFSNTFGSIPVSSMNGVWKLFVADQGNLSAGTKVTWGLTFQVTGSNAPTTTTIAFHSGSPNPSFTSGTNSQFSIDAHVEKSDNSGPATTGTVTLHDNTTNTDVTSNVAINTLGNATITGVITTEGPHDLSVNYNGGTGFAASSSTTHLTQTVVNHATINGNTACNNGAVQLQNFTTNSGESIPYPSEIILGGSEPSIASGGIIQQLSVTLNNFQTQDPEEMAVALQAPGSSTVFELMSYADGSTTTIGAGPTLIFSDTGAMRIPSTSRVSCSPTPCLPTDDWIQVGPSNPDTIPNPAGGNFIVHTPGPTGTSTLTQDFGGLGANGTWNLYVLNRAGGIGNQGSVGSWCLNFIMQPNGNATTTTVSAPVTEILSNASTTLTATVTSTGGTVNAGTVSFLDGGTNLGTVNVVNGAAALVVSGLDLAGGQVKLPEGTHHIVAQFSGTNTGTIFGVSNGTFDLKVDKLTTESGSQPYVFCNAGGFTVPGFGADFGAGNPYPSNIFVNLLPGTVKGLTVTVNGFSTFDENNLAALLVGPGGKNLDFFSFSGADTCGGECHDKVGPVNVTLDDTATATLLHQDATTGSFKPISQNSGGNLFAYPACPLNDPTCTTTNVGPPLSPNPFTPTNKAAPAGTAILGNANAAGVFGGTTASTYDANGTWGLYFDYTPTGVGGSLTSATSWCLNFTQNLPDISLTATPMTHSPANFLRGQTASFTITASNLGPGPTGNPTLTITDTLPAGLTYSGFSSGDANWNCSNSAQLVTCTHSNSIAQGNSSAVTINVNVLTTAADTISNSATLTAGTGGDNSTGDNTTSSGNITVAGTILTINKTHTDPFTQGQTNATYNLTVTNTGADGTSTVGHPGALVGTLTVTDMLPSSLTPTSISGTNWNCQALPALMCQYTAALPVGSTTSTLALKVTVSNTVLGPITNKGLLSAPNDQIGTSNEHDDVTNITQVPTQMNANALTTPQSAAINTAFAHVLAVTVLDAGNNPVPNISVSFAPPGSGASGSFAVATGCTAAGCTVNTNSSGIATASAFTANGTVGNYNVHTTSSAFAATVNFALTNTDTPATVSGVSSTLANGSYTIGQVIPITVTFSKAVNVTGTPMLALNSGGSASYSSGSGTTILTFNYTVASGQNANPLDEASAAALTLNGGTIQNLSTQNATLTLPAPGTAGALGVNKNIIVDTTAPTVTNVTSTNANGTYGVGATISITVTFSESVTVTGTPTLLLNSGAGVNAGYASGSGSNTLTFTYTVATGQSANPLDYASTAALTGTIKDAATNAAVLTLAAPGSAGSLSANKTIVIDTTAPTATGVSSTTANGSYGVGSVITVTVGFSKAVTVTGTPLLGLNSGGTASYTSGSGTGTLVFTYTVAGGQNAHPLDEASAGALTLNGGTIKDAGGNPASLTLPTPGTAGSLGVNKAINVDTTAPAVTAVTSTTANGSYGTGSVITITIGFSKAVAVTGTPLLALNSGGTASYSSGSGTSTLTFSYTVAAGQNSPKLDYTSTTALALNGGSIVDTVTNPNTANLTLPAPGSAGSIGGSKSIVIDTTAPTVTGVNSTTPNGTYGIGAVITITVGFSKAVAVTGTPLLALNSGGTATYSSGSGTSTLTFTYTVAAGQNSPKLDYTSTGALSLNGGTIVDTVTNPNTANLTLPAPGAAGSLGANKSIVINTTAAPTTVTNVNSTTASGTYGVGSVINITVTFSGTVTVTGTPQLALNSGGIASYTSGSGTSTLAFTYTVAAGQNSSALDYTSTTALTLNGGTIVDSGSNPATLTLPAPGGSGSLSGNKTIVIDTVSPSVTNVSSTTADGTYGTGAVIAVTVTFTTPVVVTGTPQLALNSGGIASYSSGSGTSTLTFTYTVAAGQNSPRLDYTSTTALSLNGGTIFDTVTNPNAANLTLPAPGAAGSLGANKNIVISTAVTGPSVVSFSVIFGNNLTYNLTTNPSGRNRLPWEITGIQVVFSTTISSADINSLTGVTTTGFSGLGTNTLTWAISPTPLGSIAAVLQGAGADAIKDVNGNPLNGGAGANQAFKVLWGDYNDDGVVNSQDVVLVNGQRSQPYNLSADMNGDGVVDINDVNVVRSRLGTIQP